MTARFDASLPAFPWGADSPKECGSAEAVPAATAPITELFTKSRRETVTESSRKVIPVQHCWRYSGSESSDAEGGSIPRGQGGIHALTRNGEDSTGPTGDSRGGGCPRKSLTASEFSQASRIFCAGPAQFFGGRNADGLDFFRPEAQQRRDVAHLVELGVVFHVVGFDVAADYPGQNRLSHVHDFIG